MFKILKEWYERQKAVSLCPTCKVNQVDNPFAIPDCIECYLDKFTEKERAMAAQARENRINEMVEAIRRSKLD